MTREKRERPETPKLPPPPPQKPDYVNDFGWLSNGYSRQAEEGAARAIAPLLLRDGEESGLPPDPLEPPPLPPPPEQEPDHDERGRDTGEERYRVPPERESGSRRAG